MQAQDELVAAQLDELVAQAREAFGASLLSVVLFGSAAEGRLRPVSDVNLLFLLEDFDTPQIDAFRPALRAAEVAIRARGMFLLRAELASAAELFALKFSDIQTRHRVLWGQDCTTQYAIDPQELRRRLREVLLNLALRLRERYALLSLREEQLVKVIADAAGPLRSAAAGLLKLRGQGEVAPRDALQRIAAASQDPALIAAVDFLSLARMETPLPPGAARDAVLALIRLAARLRCELENHPDADPGAELSLRSAS